MSFTYIEDDNSFLSPSNSNLAVLRMGDVLEEELEQNIAFFFLKTDDVRSIWCKRVSQSLARKTGKRKVI